MGHFYVPSVTTSKGNVFFFGFPFSFERNFQTDACLIGSLPCLHMFHDHEFCLLLAWDKFWLYDNNVSTITSSGHVRPRSIARICKTVIFSHFFVAFQTRIFFLHNNRPLIVRQHTVKSLLQNRFGLSWA